MKIFYLCIFLVYGSTYSNCTDGQIRLFGGSTDYEGTVEICINNAWGTVAVRYEGWGYEEAQTVCNALGYTASGIVCCHCLLLLKCVGATPFSQAYFGKGNGPIFLNYVDCLMPTFSLMNCSFNYHVSSNDYYYSHNFDVGVQCQRESTYFNLL